MKTVKDFKNHFDAIEHMGEACTNCLVHAIGKRYADYLMTESTNRRNIYDGEPMEYEAEAYEAKYDVKDGLRELEKRSDLVETLEAFVDAGAENPLLNLTLAVNHFGFADIAEAIETAKKVIASGMEHTAEIYEAPDWKVPREDNDADEDLYL